MLHLIKEKAKPVTPTKKRKKYELLGTLEEFKKQKTDVANWQKEEEAKKRRETLNLGSINPP